MRSHRGAPLRPFLRLPAIITLWRLTLAALCGTTVLRAAAAHASQPPAPAWHIQILYFGCPAGAGQPGKPVSMLCVLQNTGSAALPANTLRVKCSPEFGMDYTSGNTRPMLPAMAAGQAVAFRWTFDANSAGDPMAASAILKPAALPDPTAINVNAAEVLRTGAVQAPAADPPALPPTLALADVPVLAAPGAGERLIGPATGAPWARAAGGVGAVGNGLLRVRAATCGNGAALLLLDSGSGAAWNAAAFISGLLRIQTAEPGQSTWWRQFTVSSLAASESTDMAGLQSAALTLRGKVGSGWNAVVTLTAVRDTGMIQGQVQLRALRTMELSTLQLPMLSPQNAGAMLNGGVGTPQAVSITAQDPPTARLALVTDGSAAAVSWSAAPPLPGWTAQAVGPPAAAIPAPTGVEWSSGGAPTAVNAGTSITVPFRLMVLPAAGAADAPRLVQP